MENRFPAILKHVRCMKIAKDEALIGSIFKNT